MHEIVVRPCVGTRGWLLQQDDTEPASFRSGAAAESAARSLVRRLGAAGRPARVTIVLRDGSVAGRIASS